MYEPMKLSKQKSTSLPVIVDGNDDADGGDDEEDDDEKIR